MRKPKMSDQDFYKVNFQAKSIAEVMAATGLKKESIQQRRTELRSKGWSLPEFHRSNEAQPTTAGPTEDDYKLMAELQGVTIEQVKQQAEKIKEETRRRGEAVRLGRAGRASGANVPAAGNAGTVENTSDKPAQPEIPPSTPIMVGEGVPTIPQTNTVSV